MVEVVHVGLRTNPCAHGTDIETEEATSDGTEGGQDYVTIPVSKPIRMEYGTRALSSCYVPYIL